MLIQRPYLQAAAACPSVRYSSVTPPRWATSPLNNPPLAQTLPLKRNLYPPKKLCLKYFSRPSPQSHFDAFLQKSIVQTHSTWDQSWDALNTGPQTSGEKQENPIGYFIRALFNDVISFEILQIGVFMHAASEQKAVVQNVDQNHSWRFP